MRVVGVNIHHAFPGQAPLFSNLNFSLKSNVITGIVGPSGSGKSTFLAILAGWITPRGGELVREGIKETSCVFQNPTGIANRSVVDHVTLPLLAKGFGRREGTLGAMRILARVGLEFAAARPFKSLSGGEAQRLMLARAIARDPQLLLVDEPTAQLDRRNAEGVASVLGSLARQGTIIVIATHDPLVHGACDELVELGPS